MKYIEAPDDFQWNEKSLFVAGWISNCPDWQKEFIAYFRDTSLALINPRRYDFDVTNPDMEEEQITWEHVHLEKSDAISFWFPKETLCPITLFELWKYAKSNKQLFVGVDPDFQRKRDIEIQMRLIRPEIKIHYTIEALAKDVLDTLSPTHTRIN